jgi:hypothetical protein
MIFTMNAGAAPLKGSKAFFAGHGLAMVMLLTATQASGQSCITAGRLNAQGMWAPQFQTVRLLDEMARPLAARGKAELSRVRAVEVTQPALLSACQGNGDLSRAEEAPAAKAPVPAAKSGRLTVEGVSFPKLQTGGELVELQVQVPADRVIMVTR